MGDWNRELHHHEHHDDIEMWRSRLRIAEEALTDVCEVGDRAAVQIARAALSRIHTMEEK